MQTSSLVRALMFVAASVVSGLALAFLIVAWRPELIRPSALTVPEPATSQPTPPPAERTISGPVRVTYADAVQRAAPAVVNISTKRVVTERVAPSPFDRLFGESFFSRYRQRVEHTLGSGVIIDEQGHIVTNHHVIAGADAIRVQLADGRTADAKIVGRDPDTDLAVLQIDLTNLPLMPLGNSDQLRVGDVVLAIGDPLGLSQTVTHGIVSATSRQHLGVATLEDFIQTDAPINAGNSGGALVDTNGELVGINTANLARQLGVEGIGFAIPVNMVRGVVSEIIAKGRVVRGWIGIEPADLSNEQAVQLGLAHGGVVVWALDPGSPAVQAGLRLGDLLSRMDGAPVESAQEVMAHIVSRTPGSVIRIKALRGETPFEASIQVTERPQTQ
jgi:serine protease DegS